MACDQDGIKAVIWDFDQTLADTRHRNLNVTTRIVEHLTGKPGHGFPELADVNVYFDALNSVESWTDFYMSAFGMDRETVTEAGSCWTEFQLNDPTPVVFYDGISTALERLSHLPHGIVSLNSRAPIEKNLEAAGIKKHFRSIIGHEDVAAGRQKPNPDGLLTCLEKLTGMAPGQVLFIGDHDMDLACASNANQVLAEKGHRLKVLSAGAAYGATKPFSLTPDFHISSPDDLLHIAESLDSASL